MQQTFMCPQCRNHVTYGAAYCGQCGNMLSWQTPPVYRQPVYSQQENLNWFQRHINWTWLLVFTVRFVAIPFDSPIGPIISILGYIGMIIITAWALHRKSRSYWWILIPIAVLFLTNNRTTE